MNINRRHLATGFLLVLALLLAACSGQATATATTAPASGATPTSAATPTGVARDPGGKEIILATTTSTQDSGLLDVLLPAFTQASGYTVKPVAVGSGQALKMGSDGNADVLLVHSPAAEQTFMSSGAGVDRRLVMHNDFVIIGPGADPAHVKGDKALAALSAIATARAPFVSRGDNSGTNALELSLWKQDKIDPAGQSWYIVSGQGMGATLTLADQKDAYTISDRATYLAYSDRIAAQVLVEKDAPLLNIYHVIRVSPDKWPQVNTAGATAFADYVVSPDAQKLIGAFGVDKYKQALFVPDAGKDEKDLAP